MTGRSTGHREMFNALHKKYSSFPLRFNLFECVCFICNNFTGNLLELLCCEKRGEISGLKIIEVKEFFSALLKIESEKFTNSLLRLVEQICLEVCNGGPSIAKHRG